MTPLMDQNSEIQIWLFYCYNPFPVSSYISEMSQESPLFLKKANMSKNNKYWYEPI